MASHTFVVYVEDRPGVLNRVASLCRRRGFNIESLAVGHAESPGVSRMTIVVDTDAAGARRIEVNLSGLVNVLQVQNITDAPTVCRDLVMIKVAADAEVRAHLMQLVDVFRARIIDVAPRSVVIEMTGTEDKIDGFLEVLRPYGVLELVRTGRVAMVRGHVPAARAELTGDAIPPDNTGNPARVGEPMRPVRGNLAHEGANDGQDVLRRLG